MSTRNPRPQDELDFLIEESLRLHTEDEEPSEQTWENIQRRLRSNAGTARKFRMFWLAPALQVALVLVLAFLQGVGPYSYMASDVTGEPTIVTDAPRTVRADEAVRRHTPHPRTDDSDIDLQMLKEQTDVGVYRTHRDVRMRPQSELPTANTYVRQVSLTDGGAAAQPHTPILLKRNLDLNR